jgi:hypothetical protein
MYKGKPAAHQRKRMIGSNIEDRVLAAQAAQPAMPAGHISTKAGAIIFKFVMR